MRARLRIPATIALAAGLVLAAPLLSGCGVINNVVSNATGGDVNLPSNSVPDDFPSEVPLADGTVTLGMSLGDETAKAWNVSVEVSGAESFDAIATQLTDAGFTREPVTDGTEATTGAFTKDELTVLVVVAQTDGTWLANYTVTQDSSTP